MSFEIHRGLFGFDFTDYHAVIGTSIDSDSKAIRKQYLKIARKLHPDVCRLENKDVAQALLSKLINPAYAKLSSDKDYVEYGVLLRMTGKRLVEDADRIAPESDTARQLLELDSLDRVRKEYERAIAALASEHYGDLSESFDRIGELSELNQVYLMRRTQSDTGWGRPAEKTSNKVTPAGKPVPPPPPPPRKNTPESFVASYYHRAESLLDRGSFSSARKELQDALKLDANNAECHALMAKVYLKQNEQSPASVNTTMARSHLSKAVKANSQAPIVVEVRKLFNKAAARPTTGKPVSKKPAKSKKPEKGGGLFGGLFGGKK